MQGNKSLVSRTRDTVFTFFALYLATLFSLDAWAAARASPHRAPGHNSFWRPAGTARAAPDSYQAGMHGRGNNGSGGSGGGGRGIGRVAQARDSRPPIKMGATASCGACLT